MRLHRVGSIDDSRDLGEDVIRHCARPPSAVSSRAFQSTSGPGILETRPHSVDRVRSDGLAYVQYFHDLRQGFCVDQVDQEKNWLIFWALCRSDHDRHGSAANGL